MAAGLVRFLSGDHEPEDVAWTGPIQGGTTIWRWSPENKFREREKDPDVPMIVINK